MPAGPLQERVLEQEICTFFNRHHGLEISGAYAVAVTREGTVWAGTALGVARFDGERWQVVHHPDAIPGGEVCRLAADPEGALWVGSSTGVARFQGGQWHHWYGEEVPTRDIHDLVPDGKGGVWAIMAHEWDLASRDVWHFDGRKWRYWEVAHGQGDELARIALDGRGVPYVIRTGKVLRLRGRRWVRVSLKAGRATALALASAPDGAVWVGTTDGVVILRDGVPERTIGKPEGMPVRGVHDIAFAPNGDVWFSHGVAASRLRGSEWRYYSPYSWFPGNALSNVAVAPEGAVWLAGSAGVGRIETRKMTLTEKSALLEALVPKYHLHDGLVLEPWLEDPEDPKSGWHWQVTDNDGSHAAEYCAAESLRYGVTKAEDARRNAREAMRGLMRLVRLTGRRGFLARAAFRKDAPGIVSVAGEWHESADGEWLWKGDTSSDELDTHMLAYGIYYDLVADQAERKELAEMISGLIGGIVDNGYVLLDLDGKHTRWGVWSPELLGSPEWEPERSLNSLEMLAHLRSALHITGERQFEDAYRYLVEKHGYAETVRTSQMANNPYIFSKFDDVLACKAYYPLLKYESDPALRAIYLDSLDRFWQFVRPERNPLFTAVANIFLQRYEDLEVIFEVLSGYRMDQVRRGVFNSLRQDVKLSRIEGRRVVDRVLPGAERWQYDWGNCSYEADRGDGPDRRDRPSPFLEVYWMSRYHGLLSPA